MAESRPHYGLFQQRVAGDDALLELAALRFRQMGLAAELYADAPDDLERLLPFVPPHPFKPMVHLNRRINVLHEPGRSAVADFAGRFTGRVAGFVVHDQSDMGGQADQLLAAMRELDSRLGRPPGGPLVFLEYAAGHDPGWFVELAERLADAERVSFCIDVGHLGVRQASAAFGLRHPDLRLGRLTTQDGRLPELAGDVQDAVASGVRDVLAVIGSIGSVGKRLHFHLHDAHPLVPGLADHFTFLTRLPIPFSFEGRRSLSMMYGPGGLESLVSAALAACRPGAPSFTLEIHQVEGRLPLADAAPLFSRWRDLTNAERMNYWLSVLGENALLLAQADARARRLRAGPGS